MHEIELILLTDCEDVLYFVYPQKDKRGNIAPISAVNFNENHHTRGSRNKLKKLIETKKD
jgi:hypothetical protein